MPRPLLLLLLALTAAAQTRTLAPVAGRRLALVIGNDRYSWAPLKNAVADAAAVADALKRSGFELQDITLRSNLSQKDMQRVIREFLDSLRADDLAFIYFSGHGVEDKGENFLIPVDFPADASESQLRDDAYSAQQILQRLENSPASTRILVLDACRNNPLRATRSAGGGLSRMDGQGTLVVFATGAGRVAQDDGLFRRKLVEALPTPGVKLREMFDEVGRRVYAESGQKQLPAIYGLLIRDFPLVGGGTQSSVAAPVPDVEMWLAIRDSNDPALFERFIERFPASPYVEVARVKVASSRQPPAAPQPPIARKRERKTNPKDGLEYVWIPPGRFRMGCSDGDEECSSDERPAHDVEIISGFWLGATEVTQAAYQQVTGKNPSQFKGADLPVETVSWVEATQYCAAVGGRLPKESEWEYAARAGTSELRYDAVGLISWYQGNAGGKTHPVGLRKPNAFGLYDMLGNVWEWVADWYTEWRASGRPQVGDEAANAKYRILRGGSWNYPSSYARVSFRNRYTPDYRDHYIGFRCVVED